MSISRQVSQHRLHYMYQLCIGVVLDTVLQEKYLGVLLSHKSYTYYSNESPPETRFSPMQSEKKST